MRKIALIALAIMASCATLPPEQLLKQEVIEFNGIKKDVLFKKSLEWVATNFGSGKQVLEYQDKETGKIIGNIVTTKTVFLAQYRFFSTMTIEVKDEKARLSFQVNSLNVDGTDAHTRGIIDNTEKDAAMESLKSIRQSYVAFMNEKKPADW